ncbi:hypothetical protein A2Z33_05415 [Candidatus Gottesmanbacteria bacterium RBG_16_52_11]|uniref:Uncharacterized protein n=1 Tax=Candidatus Gottesmanbacteria bacterium RBG_16_52_11 TaxID=1798374 RepID=A0A1F5YW40_9BACT|nr:MAG: hypothetical protein A2Z33_05415 [Candidatus Gottesmanbacteria bacterium RBG_16_52_11]
MTGIDTSIIITGYTFNIIMNRSLSYRIYLGISTLLFALLLSAAGIGNRSELNVLAHGGDNSECEDALDVTDGTVDLRTYTAPLGQVVTGVCIKAGNDMFGDGHSDTLGDGSYLSGCYTVSGIGTQTVSVKREFDSNTCKELSHIDVYTGSQPTPVPTPTETVTPTPTPTDSPTPTPTNTPTPNPTPTDTPTPTPTTTDTPVPTETPTPTEESTPTPTDSPTPTPTDDPCQGVSCNTGGGDPTPTESPSPTPEDPGDPTETPTPTAIPTTTPAPTATPTPGTSSGSSNSSSDSSGSTGDPVGIGGGDVLGASTLAATGASGTLIADMLMTLGLLAISYPLAAYASRKSS